MDLRDRSRIESAVRALASGAAAVAIGGDATGARISPTFIQGDVRLDLSAETLSALRAEVLPAPRRNLPELDPAFRGRAEDEATLIAALERGEGAQAVTALKGMGGVGKTALAARVAGRASADRSEGND